MGNPVRAGIKKEDKMSIEKLGIILKEEYTMRVIDQQTYKVFIEIYNILKDLQKQLAQKEDTIAVKDIKKVRLLNDEYKKYGKHDICALCRHYSDNGYCDIHSGYGKLVERDTCNDFNDFKEGD